MMSTENKKLFALSYEGKAVTISDNLKKLEMRLLH